MIKRIQKFIKYWLGGRKCEVCRERKPINEINYIHFNAYEQVCEDCIKGGKW